MTTNVYIAVVEGKLHMVRATSRVQVRLFLARKHITDVRVATHDELLDLYAEGKVDLEDALLPVAREPEPQPAVG